MARLIAQYDGGVDKVVHDGTKHFHRSAQSDDGMDVAHDGAEEPHDGCRRAQSDGDEQEDKRAHGANQLHFRALNDIAKTTYRSVYLGSATSVKLRRAASLPFYFVKQIS